MLLEDTKKYIYGSEFRDWFLLHEPESLPRFGHLVRKAMSHYAGDRYNPHEHGLIHETFLRGIVRDVISYKILHKDKEYDWEWIDVMLRKYIGAALNIELPYNEARFNEGYKVQGRSTTFLLNPYVTH
ncbi:hypothetical protein [Taibaiella koreensis]|uniref:hypothetical protein n=1 Tax=Taibaiella koreensis TaxID=1268548 RepID=UPI0013C36C5A|nr:hypothetical protein [Taibaiella koreensis]